MPTRRSRQFLLAVYGVALLGACLALNAWLAYRISYPPVTLRVRIVTDTLERVQQGITPDQLQERVEHVSALFEREAGIRLSVVGFTDVRIGRDLPEPESLRRYLQVRTPREESDLLVAFWPAAPGEIRLGSADPFTPVAVVRLESGSPEKSESLLAHQIGRLFGLADSPDSHSVMHSPPAEMHLDPSSRALLMQHRLFDFHAGLGGMSGRMRRRLLGSFADEPRARGENASSHTHRRLGDLLIRDHQFPVAVVDFRAALASDFQNVDNHIRLAQALALSELFPEAIGEAKAAVAMEPNHAETHYELGYVLARSGNPEAAVPEFQKAIALSSNIARYHAGLAVAYAGVIGEFNASSREFNEAERLDAADPLVKADFLYVARLHDRLERELDRAAAVVVARPDNADARVRWAMLLLRLGKLDEGMDEAQRAIAQGPETWQMHYAMAIGWYSKGKPIDAQTELRRAKQLGSGSRPNFEQSLQAALARKGA
jgi:tetratricopeptide (TPR) repeat protein